MSKLKILYVHGYMGKGNGSASRLLKDVCEKCSLDFELDAPQFPVSDPDAMKKALSERIDKYDYIVASSLGAFYLLQTEAPRKILVNPALPENLRRIKANAPAENPDLTDAFIDRLERDFNAGAEKFFSADAASKCDFIFGKNDDIAPNEAAYASRFPEPPRAIRVDMGHKLNADGAGAVCYTIMISAFAEGMERFLKEHDAESEKETKI